MKIQTEIWMGYELLEKKLYFLPPRSRVLIMASPLHLLLFSLNFPVSRFAKNSWPCQLLATYLKCRRPETWTGFRTFFNISIQIFAKKTPAEHQFTNVVFE